MDSSSVVTSRDTVTVTTTRDADADSRNDMSGTTDASSAAQKTCDHSFATSGTAADDPVQRPDGSKRHKIVSSFSMACAVDERSQTDMLIKSLSSDDSSPCDCDDCLLGITDTYNDNSRTSVKPGSRPTQVSRPYVQP